VLNFVLIKRYQMVVIFSHATLVVGQIPTVLIPSMTFNKDDFFNFFTMNIYCSLDNYPKMLQKNGR
jgi:hypothetical protein